ncbi:MAG: lipopolysaccharide biosynthesis protein [Polyangiaceae bacterium]|nr:lipopolysaccharide biosynthesis protein [Polyangiaceae bacterium]
MSDSLAQRTKSGVVHTLAGRAATAGVLFAGTAVLARLLEPRDFGVVALCFMVVDLATKVGDFGFSSALVQQAEPVSAKQVNTLFLIDLGLKLLLFLGLLALVPSVVAYFQEPVLASVLPAIGVYMVVDCFSSPSLAILVRDLNFRSTALIELTSRTLEVVVAIALAWCGYGVWSLVVGRILGSATTAGLACAAARWLPTLGTDFRGSARLIRFGGWLFVRNLAYYASDNVDFLIVGRYLGVTSVGFYSKAFEIMRLPQARVTRAVNAVLFTAFSRIQTETDRLGRGLRKAVLVTAIVSSPLLVGLAVVAPEFVEIVFGPKWEPIVRPLQIMCFAGIVHAVDPYMVSLFTATGRVRLAVLRRVAELVLLVGASLYGVRFGVEGVATAIVLVAVVVTLATSALLRLIGLRAWRDYLAPQTWPLVAAGVMGVSVLWLRDRLQDVGSFGRLILLVSLGAGVYVAVLAVIRPTSIVAVVREGLGDVGTLRERLRRALRN